MDHRHRSGKLKQGNKSHKTSGGFASKRAIDRAARGRVEKVGGQLQRKHAAHAHFGASSAREQRRLKSEQLRSQARHQKVLQKRLGDGGAHGPSRVVGIFALGRTASVSQAARSLLAGAESVAAAPLPGVTGHARTAVLPKSQSGARSKVTVVCFQRGAGQTPEAAVAAAAGAGAGAGGVSFAAGATGGAPMTPSQRGELDSDDLARAMELARLCDCVCLCLDASAPEEGGRVDEFGYSLISTMKAVGLPSVVGVLQGVRDGDKDPAAVAEDGRTPTKPLAGKARKGRDAGLHWLNRLLETEFGTNNYKAVEASVCWQLRTAVATVQSNRLEWRQSRSYMMAHSVAFVPGASASPAGPSAAVERDINRLETPDIRAAKAAAAAKGVPVDDNDKGTLLVTGYLRGRPLDCKQLFHIPGAGTFRIARVTAQPEPTQSRRRAGDAAAAGAPVDTRLTDPTIAQQLQATGIDATGSVLAEAPPATGVAPGGAADSAAGVPSAWETLAEPSAAEGEQTWPTMEEEAEADAAMGRALGADGGMREYMAPWLDAVKEVDGAAKRGLVNELDGLPGAAAGDGDEDDDDAELSDEGTADSDGDDDEEDDDGELPADEVGSGGVIAAAELRRRVEEARARREAEQDEETYPDEVETPLDQPARERFGRYRPLKSVVNDEWHHQESLPRSYSRIYRLPSFQAVQRRVLAEGEAALSTLSKVEERTLAMEKHAKSVANSQRKSRRLSTRRASSVMGATGADVPGAPLGGAATALKRAASDMGSSAAAAEMLNRSMQELEAEGEQAGAAPAGGGPGRWCPCGRFVCLWLEAVPRWVLASRDGSRPLSLWSLLRHETRTSVVHARVQRCPEVEEPVKSKDDLEIQIGFRSFDARPLFAQQSTNSTRHKFERFLMRDRLTMLSAMVPLTFGPLPVLVFRKPAAGSTRRGELVATGTLDSADPDQMILKKIVLTGYPTKISKRKAVIRFMFFNSKDVRWFAPADLHTKYGLNGKILEPLGTHGLFKARFSGQMTHQDTVCMALYKRVYPKWGSCFEPLLGDALRDDDGRPPPGAVGRAVAATAGGGDAFAAALAQHNARMEAEATPAPATAAPTTGGFALAGQAGQAGARAAFVQAQQ